MQNDIKSLERYISILFRNRPRTEFEIRDRSSKKGYSEEDIEIVVEKLKNIDLIDDKRFAIMYIEDGFRLKLKGRKLLQIELKKLGVENSIVDDAFTEIDEEICIDELLKNDFERNGTKNPQKWAARMSRRGFEYYEIKNVLKEYEADHY